MGRIQDGGGDIGRWTVGREGLLRGVDMSATLDGVKGV